MEFSGGGISGGGIFQRWNFLAVEFQVVEFSAVDSSSTGIHGIFSYRVLDSIFMLFNWYFISKIITYILGGNKNFE